jgi:large subunit ribosomal protein L27
MGKDHTLFALRDGRVSFKTGYKRRTFVSVTPANTNPMAKSAAE